MSFFSFANIKKTLSPPSGKTIVNPAILVAAVGATGSALLEGDAVIYHPYLNVVSRTVDSEAELIRLIQSQHWDVLHLFITLSATNSSPYLNR